MKVNNYSWRRVFATGLICALVGAGLVWVSSGSNEVQAGGLWRHRYVWDGPTCVLSHGLAPEEFSGTTYWLRTPEEERRVVTSLYNRYCLRCHGVDGRGVWDIPDVPDLTNARWQASRSDAQLVRLTLEGRGAVMPAFRGILTLEEAWAMARYLRTFVPGAEQPGSAPSAPAPK